MLSEHAVAIIGGGFSGTMAAVQLIRQSSKPIKVMVFNSAYPAAKGVAYSTSNLIQLLNVPAARMSAFPHEPLHFRRWLDQQPEMQSFCLPGETLSEAFLPRKIYGQYIAETVSDFKKNPETGSEVEFKEAEVNDIESLNGYFRIVTATGETLMVRKVVLAFGNFEPAVLKGVPEAIKNSGLYQNNPWSPDATENLKPDFPVFLVGTGLTMVDVVLSLREQGFNGRIYAVSTHGRLPGTHRRSAPYPDISHELEPPFNINKIYAAVKKHIRIALQNGSNCEALVDAMRPKNQQIWQGLSVGDKQRFLRHLSSLWGIFRHRLAPQIAGKIKFLQESGQLEIIAGRFVNAAPVNNEVRVAIQPRGKQQTIPFLAQRLINCTGPQTNYARIGQPLIQNLLARKLIAPEPLGLGLCARPDGRLTGADGNVIRGLFGIGPVLRGILWESTAVPEISVQAEKLAQTILEELETKINNASYVSDCEPSA